MNEGSCSVADTMSMAPDKGIELGKKEKDLNSAQGLKNGHAETIPHKRAASSSDGDDAVPVPAKVAKLDKSSRDLAGDKDSKPDDTCATKDGETVDHPHNGLLNGDSLSNNARSEADLAEDKLLNEVDSEQQTVAEITALEDDLLDEKTDAVDSSTVEDNHKDNHTAVLEADVSSSANDKKTEQLNGVSQKTIDSDSVDGHASNIDEKAAISNARQEEITSTELNSVCKKETDSDAKENHADAKSVAVSNKHKEATFTDSNRVKNDVDSCHRSDIEVSVNDLKVEAKTFDSSSNSANSGNNSAIKTEHKVFELGDSNDKNNVTDTKTDETVIKKEKDATVNTAKSLESFTKQKSAAVTKQKDTNGTNMNGAMDVRVGSDNKEQPTPSSDTGKASDAVDSGDDNSSMEVDCPTSSSSSCLTSRSVSGTSTPRTNDDPIEDRDKPLCDTKSGATSRLQTVIGQLGSKLGVSVDKLDEHSSDEKMEADESDDEEQEESIMVQEGEKKPDSITLTMEELEDLVQRRIEAYVTDMKSSIIVQLQQKVNNLQASLTKHQEQMKLMQRNSIDFSIQVQRSKDVAEKAKKQCEDLKKLNAVAQAAAAAASTASAPPTTGGGATATLPPPNTADHTGGSGGANATSQYIVSRTPLHASPKSDTVREMLDNRNKVSSHNNHNPHPPPQQKPAASALPAPHRRPGPASVMASRAAAAAAAAAATATAAATAAATPTASANDQAAGGFIDLTDDDDIRPFVPSHPAPLPKPPASFAFAHKNGKLPPPKPLLKPSRVANGIVLSWNMDLTQQHETIKAYQLYAYQQTSAAPVASLWKKVGDVKALALPMACTLTQFQDGNKYHFAVRAVDIHDRVGLFSDPGSIQLNKL